MINRQLTAAATVAFALTLGVAAGAAVAQDGTTQSSPQTTEPLPAQGAGQEAFGAAVQGSAPGPNAPSVTDNSQAQGGKLLKPGAGAGDMGAAGGAKALPEQKPQ